MLFAENLANFTEFLERFGAFGVLVVLILWFFWKGLPWLAKQYLDLQSKSELRQMEMHQNFDRQLNAVMGVHEKVSADMLSRLEQLGDTLEKVVTQMQSLSNRMETLERKHF